VFIHKTNMMNSLVAKYLHQYILRAWTFSLVYELPDSARRSSV